MASKGRTITGFAGAITLPLERDTRLEPDGGAARTSDPDLYLRPLPHVLGWVRHGVGARSEVQAAFHLPTFSILAGAKLGLVGLDRGDPFSLSLSGDLGATPVLGQVDWGGSLHATVGPRESWSLDTTVRFGASPGLWKDPALTTLAGVSLHRDKTLHIAAAATFDVGLGGAPAVFLLIGFSE